MTVQTHSVLNLVHMNASNTTNTAVVLRRRRDKSSDYWVLAFRYNKARIAAARAGGGKWHAMLGAWLFPTSAYSYASVKQLFGPETAWDDHTSIADRLPTLMKTGESSLIAFERWLVQKRYSKSTQATYIEAARLFLRFWQLAGKTELKALTSEDINAFNHDYIVANGYSRSYQNQVVNALKLFSRL